MECNEYKKCRLALKRGSPVISPGTNDDVTSLKVKREESNIHVTCCRENSAWFPVNFTIV